MREHAVLLIARVICIPTLSSSALVFVSEAHTTSLRGALAPLPGASEIQRQHVKGSVK